MTAERRAPLALRIQRAVGLLAAPFLVPLLVLAMRFGLGYRVRGVRELRRRYRELLRDGRPLLICANHLTLIDSALIIWALGSSFLYGTRFSAFPWNVPERTNFASSWSQSVLAYLLKCVPVVRGGQRSDVAAVLGRLEHILLLGEPVMVFPESGRSRTGRVSTETPAYGVGRLLGSVPTCRVLCVYLRGDHQESWSSLPPRGDAFTVEMSLFEPESAYTGLRRSQDYAKQIVAHLAAMEASYFAQRSRARTPVALLTPATTVSERGCG